MFKNSVGRRGRNIPTDTMRQHGCTPPAHPFRALAWKNFGQTLKMHAFGAIGIKPRGRCGQVAFPVGQSRDGKSYYMLGDNQDNEVNVGKYPFGQWTSFVFPSDAVPVESLPVYQGTSVQAGTEA